jgi:hypothetical protein
MVKGKVFFAFNHLPFFVLSLRNPRNTNLVVCRLLFGRIKQQTATTKQLPTL